MNRYITFITKKDVIIIIIVTIIADLTNNVLRIDLFLFFRSFFLYTFCCVYVRCFPSCLGVIVCYHQSTRVIIFNLRLDLLPRFKIQKKLFFIFTIYKKKEKKYRKLKKYKKLKILFNNSELVPN